MESHPAQTRKKQPLKSWNPAQRERFNTWQTRSDGLANKCSNQFLFLKVCPAPFFHPLNSRNIQKLWLPLASELGLGLISQMENNLQLTPANLNQFVQEVEEIRNYIIAIPESDLKGRFGILGHGDKEWLLQRIQFVANKMRSLLGQDGWIAWCG
jgi:hypothetical protein